MGEDSPIPQPSPPAASSGSTHPHPEVYWKTRRRMAMLSMFNLMALQGWTFINGDASNPQVELLSSLAWVFGAIVGAYMGFRMIERGFGKT